MSLIFLNSVARWLRQTQNWRPFATIFVMCCAHADPRQPRYFKVKHKPYYNRTMCKKINPTHAKSRQERWILSLSGIYARQTWLKTWLTDVTFWGSQQLTYYGCYAPSCRKRGPDNTIYTENQHLIVIFRQSVHRLMTPFLRQNKKASFCIVGRRTRGQHLGSINPKANIWFIGS